MSFKNLAVLIIVLSSFGLRPLFAQDSASSTDKSNTSDEIGYKTFEVEAKDLDVADLSMEVFLKDEFPIISDRDIDKTLESRDIKRTLKEVTNSEGAIDTVLNYVVRYDIKENFLAESPEIIWELNIPEYRSHLYQVYKNDTLFIDTWNNVVGTSRNKTYTGHFEAYKIRNWPSWKDPDKDKAHVPATPPGPKNPLGLFVVHYDENSLRYFHGTNKNHLIYSDKRDLSHGCVRNDNDNIEKMKQFIIKKVIKSDDLSSWLNSKRSLVYNLKEEDRFPVTIYYKTFDINKDDNGFYIEFYRDIYNYSNPANINTRLNDPSLIVLSTRDNILTEFKQEYNQGITIAQFDDLLSNHLSNPEYYQKYYFEDLYKLISNN
ncbi:MAG: L,D-transpeptidase family protein [Ignavibacteriaceae bacterium]|jgi:Uncharacterized protein conserved in bacteria|nr:MAG: hypothetical protein EDM69_02475 [Chlorobiota bacterium]KXK02388.1 MAG: murein L,D-transpeptidase [Chlorobi bacterium OLB4]MBV6397988.1 hypothetical protein [Ignavibacteria bacterium]MCC6886435.1 L,D-transpeptidase family protein [Ignavibacteriales bacterium]MCE7952489.1 hypothetical protein [Chlorobi bacterium CHB7]MDL1886605.1 hypothetical protein [Ignavibacteria bacterium CHB1]MEB2329676.1 L,D-transpeptidase family protein [Ignavibacteriaceae bacterium]OQY77294.1 MAG: hypothetical